MKKQRPTFRSVLFLGALALVALGLSASIGPPAMSQRRGATGRTNTRTPAPPAVAPLPVIEKMEPTPAEVARGSALIFRGQNFPANPGGKVARSAGPVIDEIITRLSSLEFSIKGRILSKDASFRINDEDVPSDLIERLQPEIVESDDQGGPNTAKLLRLKILTPKPQWLKDGTLLTIINPDGQKAVWKYDVGPALTEHPEVTFQGGDIHFLLKGANLSPSVTVTAETPEGTSLSTPIAVKFPDPDSIEIMMKNPQQDGTLVLTNPDQRSLRIPFTV